MARKKSLRKRIKSRRSHHVDNRVIKTRRMRKSRSSAKNILDFLGGQRRPVSLGTIMAELHFPGHQKKAIQQELTTLVKTGKLGRQGKKYLLQPKADLVEATLDLNAKGFGFAVLDKRKGKDPFIAPPHLGGASHGDRILISITGGRRNRPEARVVKVIKRKTTQLAGIYVSGGKTGYVIPDNEKLPYQVSIRRSNSLGAKSDTAVVVKITDFGSERRHPEGKIIEILGAPDSVSTQIRMAMIKYDLSPVFPANVIRETENLEPVTTSDRNRQDLRHLGHVTIDGETAKDFDDAIFVEESKKGFRLYVSIADVGHYVRIGSAIDKEAYQRGTSVYMPGRVIPMLPERLSNDLCSLVPNQDRPAFTAILDFDSQGRRVAMHFTKSLITSRTRFTYTQVSEILYDKDEDQRHSFQDSLTMLEAADKLTRLLHKRRMARGSLGFVIPQADIRLDKDNTLIDIGHQQRNPAHLLIEECMLAANEAVAEFCAEKQLPTLFRIHENPAPEKVDDFTKAAMTMGLQLPHPLEQTPAWFAKVLDKAASSPSAYIFNNLLLRTMQRARYSPQNLGHFGLAADYYTHFTSPIRRYPDLIVHRALLFFLQANTKKLVVEAKLDDAATHLSARERVAVTVERDLHARLSTLFMEDKVGDEFEAIISGVTSFGLFIELVRHYISGAVPVRDMKDDYYIHDPESHRLTGERSGRTYQLGDIVQVRLVRVDFIKRQLNFEFVKNGNA